MKCQMMQKALSDRFCIVAYVAFSFTQANRTLYLVLVLNLFSVIANISWFFQGINNVTGSHGVFLNTIYSL